MDRTDLPTADALREFQASHAARLREIQERGAAVKAELEATELSATSADGAVTVVVGAGGVLKDITFGSRAAALSPPHLRTHILDTYRTACAKAADRSVAAIAKLVGPDNPTFQLLRDAIPPGTDSAPDGDAT